MQPTQEARRLPRRSHLAVMLIALLAVGTITLGTDPRGPALAADPISEAKARQEQLQRTLQEQETQLRELRSAAQRLSSSLEAAEAELAELTAEYERVVGLLQQVKEQIAAIKARIAELQAQIAELDAQLQLIAADIAEQTEELRARETLLEDHLRTAYEQSQTSVLEMLLSADSLEAASNQVGYLLTMSEQDKQLAEEIRVIREELRERRRVLADGRRALAQAREQAEEEQEALVEREAELAAMEIRVAELRDAADVKRAEQERLLNDTLAQQGNVAAAYEKNSQAAKAQEALIARLVAEEAERQRQIEEAKRREAERREAMGKPPPVSTAGFAWPEASFRITQEFGPTSFALEPPYTYRGTYYQHFHTGIDMANGCGTPIMASKAGVVVASGQPLAPYDSAYGVIIDHGGGVQTWYWHLQPRVVVAPGAIVIQGQVIGYEGNTGFSTGCHLHFAVNVHGGFENPRFFLP